VKGAKTPISDLSASPSRLWEHRGMLFSFKYIAA
jgi:hypothetical protein